MTPIYFDMDGTVADLYAVENWLPKLRNEDPSPYAEAVPLVHMATLARLINKIQDAGYTVGIISWLSKNSTIPYDNAVTKAKKKWLQKHLPSVVWDEIIIAAHGTPKYDLASAVGILFDDEEKNRTEWEKNGGKAYTPDMIFEVLRSLK